MAKVKAEGQSIPIEVPKGERAGPGVARKLLHPVNRHGLLARVFHGSVAAKAPEADQATLLDFSLAMRDRLNDGAAGDLTIASEMLTAQALSLDGIFTTLALRASGNMGAGYLGATERYMRLALKAQAQSRATIEALGKLHQPREQTVRHLHVNDGGQAIVADQFHNHAGGQGNARAVKQSHAAGEAGVGSALPCPDPERDGVPVPSSEGKAPMSNARRDEPRRTPRKP